MNKIQSAHQWETHTYTVINELRKLNIDVSEAESSLRAYLLSENIQYTQNIEEKLNSILVDYEKIKDLTRDNIQEKNNLIKLEPLLQKRISMFRNLMQFDFRNEAFEKRNQLIQDGQFTTGQIKEVLNEMYDIESDLLQERQYITLQQFNLTISTTTIVNFLNIIFLIIILIIFNQLFFNLKRSQEEAKRSESFLQSIFSGTGEFIAVLDLNFKFLKFNKAFENEFKVAFGKRPIIGTSIKDALAHLPEEQKKAVAIWQRALNGEEFTVIEEFGLDKKNKKTYEISYSSIYDDKNNLVGASHIVRDVSSRAKYERKLKESKEKLEAAFSKLEIHSEKMKLINAMDSVLSSSYSLEETLKMIALYLKKLLPFSSGTIYLINSSRNYLEASIDWNNPKNKEKIFSPDSCWALRQGNIYTFIKKDDDIQCGHINKDNLLSYCCIPLLAQNDVMGVLYVEMLDANQETNYIKETFKNNLWVIQNLSGQIALAISNIKLKESLKKRSTRDPLTDLYNRSYLNETLDRDIQRAKRNAMPIAAVMMDLDFFKKVNDTYGHDAGDTILRSVSQLLIKKTREGDIVCRYGGEEFLLILYDSSSSDAFQRIEELRKEIEEFKFKLTDVQYSITASFGIAVFPEMVEDDPEKLIKAADAALYQSKRNGRNTTTIYKK